MLMDQGTTIHIFDTFDKKAASSGFWQIVSDRMKDLQKMNHVNGIPSSQDNLEQLKVGGALIPRLQGLDNRLV